MTPHRRFDVAIVGSGFAGSLLAWILSSQSMRVLLVDRQQHPRFAIGESSTPLADLLLRKLGKAYRLNELIELSTYANWKRTHPELACGPKRGFSYYHHSVGRPFHETLGHPNSLLVTASASDETADTHWFRQDIDAYLVRKAIEAGAEFFDQTQVTNVHLGAPIGLSLHRHDAQPTESVSADFLVNASGRE